MKFTKARKKELLEAAISLVSPPDLEDYLGNSFANWARRQMSKKEEPTIEAFFGRFPDEEAANPNDDVLKSLKAQLKAL